MKAQLRELPEKNGPNLCIKAGFAPRDSQILVV